MAKKKKSKKGLIIFIVIALILVGVLVVLPAVMRAKNPTGMYMEEKAEKRDLMTYYIFTGIVEADGNSNIISSTTQKVLSVNYKKGDAVKKGDIIAELDRENIEYNISLKEAVMSTTDRSGQYNISNARKTYDDYRTSVENGTNSQLLAASTTVDNAKTALDNARKNYEDAKAELDNSTDTSLVNARRNVETAEKNLSDAKKDYDEYLEKVNEEDYYSLKAYEDARKNAEDTYRDKENGTTDSKLSDARKKYNDALQRYNTLMTASENAELIAEAKYEMDSAKAEYDRLSAKNETLKDLKENYDDAVRNYDDAKKKIDDSHDSTLKSLSKAVEAAELNLETAKLNLESTEKGLNKNIDNYYTSYKNAQKNYDDAVASYNSVKISVDQTVENYRIQYNHAVDSAASATDDIELKNLYRQLEECTITANADGVISELNLSEGSYVSANQKLVVITDYSKKKISIKIDEYDINKVAVGDELQVYVNALDKTITGKLDYISEEAQATNGISYFSADVVFDNEDDVRVGLSVEVKLISRHVEDAVSVSVKALSYEDDNSAYVMVLSAANTLEKRPVVTGMSDGTYIEITEGVSEDESIYYMDAQELAESLMMYM